jgi:hypothetical protein
MALLNCLLKPIQGFPIKSGRTWVDSEPAGVWLCEHLGVCVRLGLGTLRQEEESGDWVLH